MSIIAGVDLSGLEKSVDDACATIGKLRRVAEAAKNLVAGAHDYDFRHASVDEASLVLLESALEDAGYGMTEEEFDRELGPGPLEPDLERPR